MTFPPVADEDAATRMLPLFERGRESLRIYLDSFPPIDRPIGSASLDVVRQDDFVAHAALCLRHVLRNDRTIYILTSAGQLCALLSPYSPWRKP